MHPVLFSVGGHEIRSYTVCLALALGALFSYLRWAKGAAALRTHFWTLFFAVAAGAMLGGRWIGDGRLSTFGAILGIVAAVALCVRATGLGLRLVLDLLAPVVSVGHGIGRTGCFLAGCCFGSTTVGTAGWGVAFTDPRAAVPPPLLGVPLYPVQLYEAAGDFCLGALLYFALLARPNWAGTGRVFAAYAAGYGILRLAVDRHRPSPATFPSAVLILAAAAFALVQAIRRVRASPPSASLTA